MSSVLSALRDKANREYASLQQERLDFKDDNEGFCGICQTSSGTSSSNSNNDSTVSCACNCETSGRDTKAYLEMLRSFKTSMVLDSETHDAKSAPEGVGARIVMANFRRLLWYWQEYYLRRGRDRLSVEFSCHIPFRVWSNLVGKSFGNFTICSLTYLT